MTSALPVGDAARSTLGVAYANAPRPRPVTFRDHVAGFGLAAVYVLLLVKSAHTLGYARDEGFYSRAAESYERWFEELWKQPHAAMERGAVDSMWSANHEHPALVKSLFALSRHFLYRQWHLFREEGTSLRFPAMCLAGGALWLLYIWGARARSRTVGLMAALFFAAMPRVFYQSHLDCFDIPIVTMWCLCAYAYWRSIERGGFGWALATGILFGLALETKHNSWFLPFAVLTHAVLARGTKGLRDVRAGTVRVPTAILFMAVLGPALFIGLWPWLWFDTAARVAAYVQFHLNHDYYNMVFLGETYWKPPMPRGYAWVMTAATVPAITLLLFLIGLGSRLFVHVGPRFFGRAPAERTDRAHTDLLWAICLVVPYAPWFSTNTPIFGGTKHWMTAYPFLCLFAAMGFELVAAAVRRYFNEQAPRFARWGEAARKAASAATGPACNVALGAMVLAAPIVETAHAHPWGLSNYTPLVGGAPGAASLGLNRQFWGFTTGAVTDFLNSHVPPGGTVYMHDTAGDSWDLLQRDGRLDRRIQGAWHPHAGTLGLYHHEDHMEGVEYQLWEAYGTATPVDIGVYDGVPIIYVYAKPGSIGP